MKTFIITINNALDTTVAELKTGIEKLITDATNTEPKIEIMLKENSTKTFGFVEKSDSDSRNYLKG